MHLLANDCMGSTRMFRRCEYWRLVGDDGLWIHTLGIIAVVLPKHPTKMVDKGSMITIQDNVRPMIVTNGKERDDNIC